jgi:hypothetical protein
MMLKRCYGDCDDKYKSVVRAGAGTGSRSGRIEVQSKAGQFLDLLYNEPEHFHSDPLLPLSATMAQNAPRPPKRFATAGSLFG